MGGGFGGKSDLDRVPNPHPDTDYLVRFAAPEFTSLCPVTGQPDFAHLVIDYAPAETIVESKILKLFLGSLPQPRRLPRGRAPSASASGSSKMLKPQWLRIGGYWYPRGGMPIDVFWQTGAPPEGCGCPTRASRPIAGAARPASASPEAAR